VDPLSLGTGGPPPDQAGMREDRTAGKEAGATTFTVTVITYTSAPQVSRHFTHRAALAEVMRLRRGLAEQGGGGVLLETQYGATGSYEWSGACWLIRLYEAGACLCGEGAASTLTELQHDAPLRRRRLARSLWAARHARLRGQASPEQLALLASPDRSALAGPNLGRRRSVEAAIAFAWATTPPTPAGGGGEAVVRALTQALNLASH